MAVSGIYRIRNLVSGRVYIGSAINVERRHYDHFKSLRGGYHRNGFLQNAWNKYGENAFCFEILEKVPDREMLVSVEQKYLDLAFANAELKPYNICPTAGNMLGTRRTAECRARLAALKLGKPRCPIGIAKQAAKMRGRKKLAESIRKRTMSRAGFCHTDESREKISANRKGKGIHDDAWKAHMSSVMTGKKMPKEHGEKLREAHRSLTKEQVAEIVRLRKEGATYIELAKQFNSTKDTVRNWCMKEGLEQKNPYLTKAQVTEIKMRRADGQTYDQIAEAMGISKVTIWYKVGKKHAQPEPLLTTPEPAAEPDPNQLSFL